MARVIGFVKSLQNGIFFAKDEQGAIRELKAGDQVFQNELVYGSPNNPQNAQVIIDVALANAQDITLSGSAQLYTDISVLGGAFEKEEAIVSKDSVESAWKLSTGTPNLEGQVDAPAAGLAETAAGVGVSDTERAGGPVFDARTGAAGDVTTTTQSTVNGTLNPNLAGPDTQNLNDRPVVADVTGTVKEALDGQNEITGQLVASDPDVGDTHTFFAVEGTFLINGEPAPEGVTFVLNEDGTYSVIGDFNTLAIGENAVITFQYYAVDNGVDVGAPHNSLPATVTITIQGTNDQPVVSDINANGGSGEVAVEEFSAFGPASGITIQVNGHDVTTSNQNGYYYSAGYNGMYGVSGYSLEIQSATADAVITFPYEVESFSFRAGAVNGSNENIRVLYTDGSTETINIADNCTPSLGYQSLISATAPTGKMISGFIILDGTDYWLLDGIAFNGSRAIYETHDNGEGATHTNDVLTTFEGSLVKASQLSDDDTTDTHTFKIDGTPSVNNELVTGLGVVVEEDGSYTVSGNFNALAAGEKATVTFKYYALDDSGAGAGDANNESARSVSKTVTLTITGTNDQPVISDININTPLSFGSENWFAEGNGLTITGYENNGSVVTPILHEGGLGIGSGWGEDSQINDQASFFGGRSAEAIVFGFEKAFNTATIELTSLNQETWFNNAEKAEWIAYKDGVEVGRGILTAQSGADIFTIHTASDFNSLKIAPPLDWETDSFYVKSLNVSKSFYESDTPVMSTFTGNLDAIVADDDASDKHTFAVYGNPSAGSELVTDLGVVVNPDGSYSVTGNFNALAVGEKVTVTFQYVAIDDSGVGAGNANNESSISAPKTVTLTITGTNDAPILASVDSTGSVQEDTNVYISNDGHHGHHDAPSAGILKDTGVIAFTDVDLSDTHTVSVASNRGALGTLTAVVSENNDGDGVGSVTWTYSVNNASVQYLAANETREETFTITVRDNNGATDTQEVKVTITGTNDVPVLASEDSHGSVKEDTSVAAGVLKDTGVIAFADVDLSDTHTVSVAPNAGALGTLTAVVSHSNDGDGVGSVTWTYSVSNASVQYLAANETRVETFTITVKDNNGATDTQEVKVTIIGTNDAPILASVDSTGSVQEDTGVSAGVLKDTGVIAFTDVDLSDTHTVSVAPNAGVLGTLTAVVSQNNDGDGVGSVTWIYSVNNASVQYLAANETREETFTITVRDNNGATDTQEVKVTITGTNDVPVITNLASALVGAVTEDASATTVSGQLAASDVDHGATKAWSIVGTPSTTYGAISIDATGKWTYTLNNALSTTQALGVNDHVTQTYTARVTDDKGAFVDQTITVTINGAYDAPVVTAHANADHIITNAGTDTFVVPEWALLANDTGTTDITGVSNVQQLNSVTLNTGSISVTDGNVHNIGSFDYTANGSTAHVDVTQSVGQNMYGGNGNDIMIGDDNSPNLMGGNGNDILIGGSGNDYLYGQNGNDTLVYDSRDGIIDGGNGTDTLVFTQQNPNIDFSYWYGNNEPISGIEVFDLSKTNVNLTNISYRDVLDITDNGKLTILGDAADNVDFEGNGWSKASTPVSEVVNGVNHTFDVYTNDRDATVVVKVEQNIHDTI